MVSFQGRRNTNCHLHHLLSWLLFALPSTRSRSSSTNKNELGRCRVPPRSQSARVSSLVCGDITVSDNIAKKTCLASFFPDLPGISPLASISQKEVPCKFYRANLLLDTQNTKLSISHLTLSISHVTLSNQNTTQGDWCDPFHRMVWYTKMLSVIEYDELEMNLILAQLNIQNEQILLKVHRERLNIFVVWSWPRLVLLSSMAS